MVQGEGADQAALVVHQEPQEPPVVHEEVQHEVEEQQEEDEEGDEDEAQDEEEEDEEDEEGEPQEEQVQGEVFEEEAGDDDDEGQEVDPGEFNVDSEDDFGDNIYHYSPGDSNVDSEDGKKKRERKPLIQGSSSSMIEVNAWANIVSASCEGADFHFVFSECYHSNGIINVPLDFAREHFCKLRKTTDVVMRLYHTEFKAKLMIKTYDGRMVQCFIKDGVDAMIDEYEVQIDEGAA
ncbi:histone chaperone ASF1-like [Chenopodium quinoa]|uniref:histone chaperone ASF1-like n=1 Tax=Chenopodium quinoa TaxID=63459 RepID=UPI000B796A7E|nr:histone chaperone ASF1-like [Chenopodium quinoa]